MTNIKEPWLVKEADKQDFIEVMGAKVFLKPLKYGKSRQALNLALKIDARTGQADMDSGLLATLRALYQIDDWEFTKDGQKLPITLDTLDNILGESIVDELITKINNKSENEVTEDEKKQ